MTELRPGEGIIETPRENQNMILRMFLGKDPKENFNKRKIFKSNNPTDTTILESPQTDRRVDEFIIEEFRDILRPERTRPSQPPSENKRRFRSSTGLSAVDDTGFVITVGGQTVLSPDEMYTRIDFVPEFRTFRDPTKVTESLKAWIDGLIELLDAIEQGRAELTPIFVLGDTNINMALITQRFGFEITDQCRTENGEIDRNRKSFTAIGRLDQIKERVDQFKQSVKYDRLETRAGRLQSTTRKPELVPSRVISPNIVLRQAQD